MKIERNQLFRELTPPEGGAARMRARLAAEPGGTASWPFPRPLRDFAALGVAAVLLLAILAGVGLVTMPSIDPGSVDGGRIAGDEVLLRSELYASTDLDRLLGRASTPFELAVSLGDERLELIEIPTRDPRVRIVRIGESLPN